MQEKIAVVSQKLSRSSERSEVKDWSMGKLIGGHTVRKWLAHLNNLGNMHSVEFVAKYILMAEYLLVEKNTQILRSILEYIPGSTPHSSQTSGLQMRLESTGRSTAKGPCPHDFKT